MVSGLAREAVALACLIALAVPAAEPAPKTSLADPSVRFTVPNQPYIVLRRGAIEAVIVDNRAVDDDILPGHRAGYHGVASLKHQKQRRNLFVPAYSGLNFEHIHDGTVQKREILFEPRHAPMELRVIDSHTAELHQPPTRHWGLESCQRYRLIDEEVIEFTFECIPRRVDYKNGYIGLFWANYIDRPESRDTHFLTTPVQDRGAPNWVRATSPQHGVLATHVALDDKREFVHDTDFPLTLVFNHSNHRFAEPWYLGVCREMTFVQVFRPQDRIRFSQSPSGGGATNPAWDFQWFIADPKVGQRYQLVMRVLYRNLETKEFNPFESQEHLLEQIGKVRLFR